jgi:hypothetical protein
MNSDNSTDRDFTVTGKTVWSRLVALMKEGNRYHVVLSNAEGRQVVGIPATFAAIFAIIFPAWVVIAVVLALVSNFPLTIRRPS